MKSSLFLFALFAVFAFIKRDELLSVGQEQFFPSETSSRMEEFTRFKLSSWNNIFLKDSSKAHLLCQKLRTTYQNKISHLVCDSGPTEFSSLIKSYLHDQFLIFPAPTLKYFKDSSNTEIAKLSLLMGPDAPELMSLIRLDPLDFKMKYLAQVDALSGIGLELRDGLLWHKDGIISIPVQFNYPPRDVQETFIIRETLSEYGAVLIGPHEGHLSNQKAIRNDLEGVGVLTTVLAILFVIFVAKLKMWKLAKLVLPAGLGVCFSFFVTWLIYGRVHGITLSFGSGIIGLAIDYGFHYIFAKEKGEAWKSNLYALLTSLMVFAVFLFSSVPLIRQMMVFSTVGLVASYIFSRLLLKDDHIDVDVNISFPKSRLHLLSLPLIFIGIYFFVTIPLDTSLQRFNYAEPSDAPMRDWYYGQLKKEKMFFKVFKETELKQLEKLHHEMELAQVRSETIYKYLPYKHIQESNLESWVSFNKDHPDLLDATGMKVFKPFYDLLTSLRPDQNVDFERPPEYLSHLINSKSTVGLWFPKDDAQEKILKSATSGKIDSLKDIIVEFTSALSREIMFLMPFTILAIWLLLFYRYRDFKQSTFCLVPFFVALSFYALVIKIFSLPLSFMGLLGLFLIYGVSVDYGIFSADFFTKSVSDFKEESSLNLSLLVNWVSGVIGFLPLVWCDHPVLKDLGLVLVIGMIGIFYSSFFLVPALFLSNKKAV